MAGPTPMALGPFAFQALGFSFDKQSRDVDASWSSLPVAGRLDALHWTGPKSDSFTISGAIFEEAFGGQSSLDGITQAALAGRPLMLVTRSGRVHGLHVVEKVSEGRKNIRGDGLARVNTYKITLKRYSGPVGGALASVLLGVF